MEQNPAEYNTAATISCREESLHQASPGDIFSGEYRRLEIFLKSREGKKGKLRVRKTGCAWNDYPAGQVQFILRRISLEPDSWYEMELSECEAGIAYLSEADDILDRGIRFLEYHAGQWIAISDLAAWYDTPGREQYHFNAYRNWINDPNGLCYFRGYYHLYYQANPHRQEWGHMYWGHAASRDLIHWVHLPYALEPQPEILEAPDRKGGAFSGCAVPEDDKIVFYLTRHFGPPEDTEEDTVQYQNMTSSADSIHFEPETRIIDKPDERFSYNFRDPKVWFQDNLWQMVIGAKIDGIPVMVRYTSDNMRDWKYAGKLLEEKADGLYAIECPDFFRLNGRYVAVDGWMMYTDKHQRYQPTYYYVGDWENGIFRPGARELYDFGSSFYAVQSFEHDDTRIAVGWTADFYHEHEPERNGSCGAMTIPRELSVKNGILYQKPVREIYAQLGACLCRTPGKNLTLRHLNSGCWYGQLTFTGETEFELLIGQSAKGSIRLLRRGNELEIKTEGVRSQHVRFVTQVETLRKLEIFSDRRLFEIYVNDGERAGAKLFYQDCSDSIFQADFSTETAVSRIELYEMMPIWNQGAGISGNPIQ